MFQKRKRRFILTNMAMLTVVLLISFTAIYLITAYHIQSQNLLKLENIHSNTLRYQDAYEKGTFFQMVVTPEEYSEAFGVIVDEQDQRVFDSSFGILEKEWVNQAIEQTNGRNEGQIVLEGRRFLFSRAPAYAKVDSSLQNAAVEQFNQIDFFGCYRLHAQLAGAADGLCGSGSAHPACHAGN
ncbi:hypothetical protein [Gemmiger sp. An50]|uniref:hypothetical protein n=1 Tax=Gemmiger sp. An50 TaxID=1965639 RepID=UPI0013A63E80|nr:hypothetical protein [Gemmiger sp. An50]